MPTPAPLLDPAGFPLVTGDGDGAAEHDHAPAPWADASALDAAGALLRALASPVRMRIVLHLARGPRCVHELVDAVALPQPLVSQHLRVLRISRLVRAERTGREIVYSLVDGHVAHVVADAVAHARESRGNRVRARNDGPVDVWPELEPMASVPVDGEPGRHPSP